MSKNPKNIQELQDAPQINSYESKPVQNYGLDLLKKMGFTAQRGIGYNIQNALNEPLVLKPRPKGLGLGAKQQDAPQQKPEFNKRDFILITSQPHQGMIGIVKKVKKQQDLLTIQLGMSGTQIKVKFSQAQKITQSQFNEKKQKFLKDLKQKQQDESEKKKKRLKWILPHIRCKVIDKLSPHYLKKVVVNQLLNEREFECILITESGGKNYLKQLTEKQLQTVLPKSEGIVLVLDKKFKGQKGKLLERNKQKSQVIVQFQDTLEIQKFSQDRVAEYVEF